MYNHNKYTTTKKLVSNGNVFEVKMPLTVTRDSHYCTCLGHLGWRRYTNRNDPISVALPKVAMASRKAKTLVILWCDITVANVIKLFTSRNSVKIIEKYAAGGVITALKS
jgi:hypothetical protein